MGFLPGLRFQKRIKILPGVTINLSKSGVSTSLGGHGATVNVGTSGKRTFSLGIPGTGLSYRVPLGATVAVGLVGAAVLAAIAYFVFPDATRAALHWWQPKIF
jgi:Protein of unknown function (DUF4236)